MSTQVQLTEELFDSLYQAEWAEFLVQGDWAGMINKGIELLETKNPTPSMRIEILSGIAMAQVGMASDFTRQLESYGRELRDRLFVTPAEAKVVMENVLLATKLQADGMAKPLNWDAAIGGEDAKPE